MVYIDSLLPDPVGPDTSSEWIKISNNGVQSESIGGWWLSDNAGSVFRFADPEQIKQGETVELRSTGVSLNNDGDTISLYNRDGVMVDQLGYSESVVEGEIVFSQHIQGGQPPPSPTALASVDDAGIVGGGSVGSGLAAPLLLGIVVAAVAAASSAYLWRKAVDRDG
jgi:hypothetical protein